MRSGSIARSTCFATLEPMSSTRTPSYTGAGTSAVDTDKLGGLAVSSYVLQTHKPVLHHGATLVDVQIFIARVEILEPCTLSHMGVSASRADGSRCLVAPTSTVVKPGEDKR